MTDAPRPAGTYLPVTRAGNLLFVSGQIPVRDGKLCFAGKVNSHNLEEARESARLCASNILLQIRAELKGLENVRIIKITGFVNADPQFHDHPKVIDAASELLIETLGEDGRHARAAVGVSGLPLGAMTEIDAIVLVRD